MVGKNLLVGIVVAVLAAAAGDVAAQRKREYIYGAELMTPAERERYREEAAAAKDEQAQKGFRERHRKRLRTRAHERGVVLNEEGVVVKREPTK
jgi:hypothetical protein